MNAPAAARQPAAQAAVINLPKLAKGEIYAGILLDDAGKPAHHLVLLPAAGAALTWKKAIAWAKKQGGELPTRREQSLLFANARQHIEPYWYWSSEPYDSDYAWGQYFDYGGQYYGFQASKDRARAVRRVPIQ